MIEIVALSEAMRNVVGLAERVAATDANVLVTGESGCGKDALAAFIQPAPISLVEAKRKPGIGAGLSDS